LKMVIFHSYVSLPEGNRVETPSISQGGTSDHLLPWGVRLAAEDAEYVLCPVSANLQLAHEPANNLLRLA
jgi:hypothetical protein